MDSIQGDVISYLKAIPEEKWDAYILRQDMFYRHYTEEMCAGIVQKAKETGRRKAFEILEEGADIKELIRKYGLNVKDAEDKEFIMPDSINFAEYHDGNILISKRLLEALSQKKEILREALGDFKVRDIVFCHELYHHFEDIEAHLENAGITYEVKPLPFIKKKISPESAGEIAAYEFARQMQKIDFHPYILGIIGLYEYKKETAEKIIENIMKL